MKINSVSKISFSWIVIVFLLFPGILLAVISWRQRENSLHQRDQLLLEWQSGLVRLAYPPTTKSIFALHRSYQWLEQNYEEMRGLFRVKRLKTERLTPLQFKERLLDAQMKFKQLADIQDSKLPLDIGFSEYIGGKIPEEDTVPLLTEQLTIIQELVDLLLKNKVAEIILIERLPAGNRGKKHNPYQELGIIIEIRCRQEQLLKVLTEMANTSFFTIVREIDIKKITENEIAAKLTIGIVNWQE